MNFGGTEYIIQWLPWWLTQSKICLQCGKPGLDPWVRKVDPLEKEMSTHSSILAWKIPWTEEPGRPQSMGLQRVGHHWATNTWYYTIMFKLIISRSVVSNSLWLHELQHARPPCPSPTPGVHSCPWSWWCHPAISSFVVPFSSCPQSLPASESFPMSQVFAWSGQITGVSALASFLPKKTQGWSPSEWTGWISLQLDTKSYNRDQDKVSGS